MKMLKPILTLSLLLSGVPTLAKTPKPVKQTMKEVEVEKTRETQYQETEEQDTTMCSDATKCLPGMLMVGEKLVSIILKIVTTVFSIIQKD